MMKIMTTRIKELSLSQVQERCLLILPKSIRKQKLLKSNKQSLMHALKQKLSRKFQICLPMKLSTKKMDKSIMMVIKINKSHAANGTPELAFTKITPSSFLISMTSIIKVEKVIQVILSRQISLQEVIKCLKITNISSQLLNGNKREIRQQLVTMNLSWKLNTSLLEMLQGETSSNFQSLLQEKLFLICMHPNLKKAKKVKRRIKTKKRLTLVR